LRRNRGAGGRRRSIPISASVELGKRPMPLISECARVSSPPCAERAISLALTQAQRGVP
jgi:hypothetical protein